MVDYHILMQNEKAAKLLGIDREKEKFHHYFEQADFRNLVSQLVQQKKVVQFEWKLPGRDQWLRLSCRYFANGEFAEGILVDITEQKTVEQELHQVKHELDQFIYHASHELRGPLASILGVVNLMEYGPDMASSKQYCELIRTKINGLDHLLKSIVAISLNNKNPVIPAPIEWAERLPLLLKEFASYSQVETALSIHQTEPFHSDWDRIRIILKNLLTNAFRYTNPTISPNRVAVHVHSGHREAIIKVQDNGIGIDSDYLNDIFRMFYKATVDSKGHGLGLYTVKTMTDKLKGTIQVESAIGVGTTFTVALPNLIHPTAYTHHD
jgi:hypothetical protein